MDAQPPSARDFSRVVSVLMIHFKHRKSAFARHVPPDDGLNLHNREVSALDLLESRLVHVKARHHSCHFVVLLARILTAVCWRRRQLLLRFLSRPRS